jgi:hypothetical protein
MPHYPYHKDDDIDAILGDIGLYAAVNARLASYPLRGGVRSDLFTYDADSARRSRSAPVAEQPAGRCELLSQSPISAGSANRSSARHRRGHRAAARVAGARAFSGLSPR